MFVQASLISVKRRTTLKTILWYRVANQSARRVTPPRRRLAYVSRAQCANANLRLTSGGVVADSANLSMGASAERI
eukprot:5362330-Amphidinium_carterae.1